MSVIGVYHSGLTVRDMEASLNFYVDLLGLTLMHTQVGDDAYTRRLVGIPDAVIRVSLLRIDGASPGLSGHVLELLQYVQPAGRQIETRPCDPGAAHLAFATRDCQGLFDRLRAAGVACISEPVTIEAGINKGGKSCYLRDPDGFIVELVQPPSWRLEGRPAPAAET